MGEWLTARRLFRHYGPRPVGLSVLKIDGEYITMDYPDQGTLAVATEIYLGGHVYVVSDAVATELEAAGYDIEHEVGTWGSHAPGTWGEAQSYQWGEM